MMWECPQTSTVHVPGEMQCLITEEKTIDSPVVDFHGSLNVPIEHHPTIRYMVYNGYYKVMSNIPKMGQLPTPDFPLGKSEKNTFKHP